MITIHDVAKHSGVSIATVSNVINNNAKVSTKTAQRVKQAIQDLNYIPNHIAKGLKKNTTRTIGVLMEDISSFASPYIIDSICRQCESDGYNINIDNLRVNTKVNNETDDMFKHLAETDEFLISIREAVNTLLSARICGLIYVGVHPRDIGSILPPLNIPVVYTYCYSSTPASDKAQCISYDDYQGAVLAAKYIISQGHTKTAVIGGMTNSHATKRRLMGYCSALIEHGLQLSDEHLVYGNWTYESGYCLTDKLFGLQAPPTAVFAMNDLMAFGAIDALKKKGLRVPEDVSVHGFDDIQAAFFFSPPLTTITLPLHEIGEAAADSVIKMSSSDGEALIAENILIPCKHVKRASIKQIV